MMLENHYLELRALIFVFVINIYIFLNTYTSCTHRAISFGLQNNKVN